GQMYTLLVGALAMLLDGRRRSAARAQALGIVDEVAAADALSHALGVARRIATGEFSGALFSPLTEAGTLAFPNVERDTEIARLLAHHAAVPRSAPAAAIVEAVRTGLTQGLRARPRPPTMCYARWSRKRAPAASSRRPTARCATPRGGRARWRCRRKISSPRCGAVGSARTMRPATTARKSAVAIRGGRRGRSATRGVCSRGWRDGGSIGEMDAVASGRL